jgi:hypothetical protein
MHSKDEFVKSIFMRRDLISLKYLELLGNLNVEKKCEGRSKIHCGPTTIAS